MKHYPFYFQNNTTAYICIDKKTAAKYNTSYFVLQQTQLW